MKKLFKNRNYFLLFQGSLVSAIGTSLYSFAAGLYVQDLFGEDGGAVYLSLFVAISIIVQVIFSPIAGLIADKWNKIRILYITDFVRALLFFATLYILSLGFEKEILIWLLLGVTALASLNQAFFGPAATAVIPEVVGEDMIQAANGANSIIGSVQGIFGIIGGMFLYALVGFEIAVLINAISFIFSAFSEMFIRTHFKKTKEKPIEAQHFLSDIKFGFKYLFSKEGLFTLMMFSLVLNFCFTPLFSVGIPYLFRTELARTPFELGATEIVFSISMLIAGILVGGMTIKNLNKTVRKGIIYLSGAFIFTSMIMVLISYNIIGYWLFYALFIIANILLAFTMMYTNIPINTGLMKAIEPNVRGRVFATISALSMGAIPLSVIAGGFIINQASVALLGIICSGILIITIFIMLRNKKIPILLNGIDADAKKAARLAELNKLQETA
ncbi:MAG: MFS transporter [Tenericutes bacterium]|nr:MFS transporter [Mycoplasmatota bacterium]